MTKGIRRKISGTIHDDRDSRNPFGWLLSIIILTYSLSIILLRFVGNSMYPFFTAVYFLTACYIILLAIMVTKSHNGHFYEELGIKPCRYFILIIGLTVGFRLAFLGSEISISLDPQWYLDFGKFMMNGQMPYADFYFPYPPVFAYFIYPISLLWPSVDSFRLLAMSFDVLIVCVLWKVSTREPSDSPLAIAPFAYGLFPISVIESGINGHFEPISNLFLLLAIVFVLNAQVKQGGGMLGLSIATKVYAAFLLPLLIPLLKGWRKRLEFIISTAATGILTFIPLIIPVWLRGDMILPGTAVPGSDHSGFLGSLLDALPATNTLELGLTILVGIGIVVVCSLAVAFLAKRISSRKALGYDATTFLLGVIFLLMALIAAIYPFTTVSVMVFWRYPADVGIVRGVLTILGAALIITTAWRRWKNEPKREISIKQGILLISTAVMILLSLFTDVFYGWYLLWCIPSLLLLRDKKIIVATIVCLLVVYPSYTHDNFTDLGFRENRKWYDEFDTTNRWEPPLVVNGSISHDNLEAFSYSMDSTGLFFVKASNVENEYALSETWVIWEQDVIAHLNAQDEFVAKLSVNWDPTFERYADVAINLTGYDAAGQAVNGILLPRNYSPTNLTSVLWRRSLFRLQSVKFPLEIEKIRLIVYPLMPRDIMVSIDAMYMTEYHRINRTSFLLIPLLLLPNILAIYFLHEYALNETEKDDRLSSSND